MKIKTLFMIISLGLSSSAALADETTYRQSTQPDGSQVMEYQGADGTYMKQIKKPDGTVETETKDAAGNNASVSASPDGTVKTR